MTRHNAFQKLLPLVAGLVAAAALSFGVAPAFAQGNVQAVAMYRLYNPYTGEHLYTSSASELSSLDRAGWRYEGIGWYAPLESSAPVYRLYNSYTGDHHYTTSLDEYNSLVSLGWSGEGVGWYSDDAQGVPLYRQFNPMRKSARTTTQHPVPRMTTLCPWDGMRRAPHGTALTLLLLVAL